jgi:hypothetical protein
MPLAPLADELRSVERPLGWLLRAAGLRLGEIERELLEAAARVRASTADHAAPLMAELKRIERVVSRRKGD